jgi:peptidoglycan hydrolase-like protein with peptidoglycan-binding domain
VALTASQLRSELEGAHGQDLVAACLAVERKARLPRGLLVAIASRESGCRNIVGDGGHGRGAFQIDDRFHRDWLRRHGAGSDGGVPAVADGAAYAAELLSANYAFGRSKGLRGKRLLKFAVAAYNAGAGGAWKAVQESGNPDAGTTGGDYAVDVLRRMRLVRGLLTPGTPQRPTRPVLRAGDVNRDVLDLKRKLRAWFRANHPAGMPEFTLNTSYGPALATAVEVFQRLNGLDIDGVAGEQVWGALER